MWAAQAPHNNKHKTMIKCNIPSGIKADSWSYRKSVWSISPKEKQNWCAGPFWVQTPSSQPTNFIDREVEDQIVLKTGRKDREEEWEGGYSTNWCDCEITHNESKGKLWSY